MQGAREEFLKTVQFDKDRYNQFICDMENEIINVGGDFSSDSMYSYNIHYGVDINAYKNSINGEDLKKFMLKVYGTWYSLCGSLNTDKYSGELKQLILKVKNNDTQFTPKYFESGNGDILDFFKEKEFEKEFNVKSPFYVQGYFGYYGESTGDFMPMGGFLHCFNITTPRQDNVDLRLYLNIKGENLVKVASLLYGTFLNGTNIPFYFKFSPKSDRNDTLVMYTSYENAQTCVDVIKKVKEHSPELFEGAENLSPLLGKIDGFIGFGEEPRYKHSSFNSERECIGQMCKAEYFKTLQKILDKNSVKLPNGETMLVDEYLEKIMREQLIADIGKDVEYMHKNHSIPYRAIAGVQSVNKQKYFDSFLKGQEELLTIIKDERYFPKTIKDLAEKYKDVILTQKSVEDIEAVFHAKHHEYAMCDNEGKESYPIRRCFEISKIGKQLLEIVPSEKDALFARIQDIRVQAYYYKNNHVSAKMPYLNVETEKELEK